MADKEYKINIVSTADNSGFTDATDAAKKLGGSQYNLGEDLGKVEKRIEGVSGQSREMYRIFSALDRIAPGLGESLRGLVTGPLGMVGALVYGLYEAKRAWNEVEKSEQEAIDAAASHDFLDILEGRLKALRSSADAAQQYADGISNAATQEQKFIEQLNKQLAIDQAIERAQAALTSAQKELDIARVQADEKSGKLTPEQAAEKRAAIEKKYIEQAERDQEAAEDKRIARLESNAKTLAINQRELDDRRAAAQKTLDEDEAHRAAVQLPKDFDERLKKSKETLDRISELEQKQQEGKISIAERGELAGLNAAGGRERAQGMVNNLLKIQKDFQDDAAKGNFQKDRDAAEAARKAADDNRAAQKKAAEDAETARIERDKTRSIDEKVNKTKQETIDVQEKSRKEQALTKGQDQIDATFKSGALAELAIQQLLDKTGLSQEQIISRANAAYEKQRQGKTLDASDQTAIERENLLKKLTDQVQAAKDLLNQMGANANSIMQSFQQMAAMHQSQAVFNKGILTELRSIHAVLDKQKNQIHASAAQQ